MGRGAGRVNPAPDAHDEEMPMFNPPHSGEIIRPRSLRRTTGP
jgi:hypothetical protein